MENQPTPSGGNKQPTAPPHDEGVIAAADAAESLPDGPQDEIEARLHNIAKDHKVSREDIEEELAHRATLPPDALRASRFKQIDVAIDELSDEPEWAVHRLIPKGGLCMIVAKPKVGKSTLARHLCVEIARGGTFLRRSVTKGSALYAVAEGPSRLAKEHFKLLGVYGGSLDLFHHHGPFTIPLDEWLPGEIEENKATLVVLDPLQRFLAHGTDTKDYSQTTDASQPLIEIADATGCAIVLPHHARKQGGDAGDEALGSTALYGSVDTMILMQGGDAGGRTLHTPDMRDGDMIEKHELILGDDGALSLGRSSDRTKRDEAKEKIRGIIGPGESLSVKAIAERSAIHEKTVGRVLDGLQEEGTIVKTGKGHKNNPWLYELASPPN